MEFDFATLPESDRYKLMCASITPRPIAWITSQSAAGVRNAAPFSFFNMMGADPPLVAIGLMNRPGGGDKDSAANILETGEFVVNLVAEGDAEAMSFTCIDAPADFDEIAEAGICVVPSSVVAAPRIASAPVSMECRLFETVEAKSTTVVIAEVLRFHIRDEFVDGERLHVDTAAMKLVARMHGRSWYARSTDLFELDRPVYADWAASREGAAGGG